MSQKYAYRISCVLGLIAAFSAAPALPQDSRQPSQPPLEYDYCGSLVPATLPHMYRWSFRLLYKPGNVRPGYTEAAHQSVKYRLHLSDAELQLFVDAAVPFGDKNADFERRFAEIRKADHEQHPDSHGVLSESARKANRAIIRERDQLLTQEVYNLHAHLTPKRAKEIDAQVTNLYANTLTVPSSTPRASSTSEH